MNKKGITLWAGLMGFAVLLSLGHRLAAQDPIGSLAIDWYTKAQYLTTTPTEVCALSGTSGCSALATGRTFWLCRADINATAGTAATVTVTDGQTSPIPLFSAVSALSSSAASTATLINSMRGSCVPMVGGVYVSASANSTIYARFSGYRF